MSTSELENWLSRVKDFSVNELLTMQEKISQELKLKAPGSQNTASDVNFEPKVESGISVLNDASFEESYFPSELAEELTTMTSFSDKALWKTARGHLTAKEAQKLRQLNHKQQKYGQAILTELELQTLEELGNQYDRLVLLRSQALLLLKERGHDISKVLKAS